MVKLPMMRDDFIEMYANVVYAELLYMYYR